MNEDSVIILEVIKGNKEAFGKIINKYSRRLYGFIFGIIGDENDSMDIVQETFFKAYENLKSFDADRNFVTWLFTIGKNNAYNYMKTRKRNMLHQVSGGLENLDGITSGSFEPEKEAVRNSERARLIDAVASLPEKYKMLIYLKYIEGLSYKEIGERLKLTESLVESRVFTARRKLAAFIKEGE